MKKEKKINDDDGNDDKFWGLVARLTNLVSCREKQPDFPMGQVPWLEQ